LQKLEKHEKQHFLQVSITACCRKLGFGVGFCSVVEEISNRGRDDLYGKLFEKCLHF